MSDQTYANENNFINGKQYKQAIKLGINATWLWEHGYEKQVLLQNPDGQVNDSVQWGLQRFHDTETYGDRCTVSQLVEQARYRVGVHCQWGEIHQSWLAWQELELS